MSGMLISEITSSIERFNMKYAIISLLSFISFNSFAGEHQTSVDKFDNTVFNSFNSTDVNFQRSGGYLIDLRRYNPNDNTVQLAIAAPRSTECNTRTVDFKTHDGIIHRLVAKEHNLRFCVVRINTMLVKNSFTIRLPIFRGEEKILEINTSTLDLNRLK
jgi:hypothetical protein